MLFIRVIGLFVCVIGLFCWGINWYVHIKMNKETNLPYNWSNFNKFIKQFNSYNNWNIVKDWKNSFFSESDYNNYLIHEEIIKINGKCMILYPISYLQFIIWRKQKWKTLDIEQLKITQ